jgi:hypothetical protein
VFIAGCHVGPTQNASKAWGRVVLEDAGVWGLAWVMFAVAAGSGLAAAATTLVRRAAADAGEFEFDGGYNALATVVDRR